MTKMEQKKKLRALIRKNIILKFHLSMYVEGFRYLRIELKAR